MPRPNQWTSVDLMSGSVSYGKRPYYDRGFNGKVREARVWIQFSNNVNEIVTVPHALGYVPTTWEIASNPSNARIWTCWPQPTVAPNSVAYPIPFSDTYAMFYCDTANAQAEIILR